MRMGPYGERGVKILFKILDQVFLFSAYPLDDGVLSKRLHALDAHELQQLVGRKGLQHFLQSHVHKAGADERGYERRTGRAVF